MNRLKRQTVSQVMEWVNEFGRTTQSIGLTEIAE